MLMQTNSILKMLTIIVIVFLMSGCGVFDALERELEHKQDQEVTSFETILSFDPDTVQQRIVQGESNVFRLERKRDLMPQRYTPQPRETLFPTPVPRVLSPWSEADFMAVVHASIAYFGKAAAQASNLYVVGFYAPCEHADFGPQFMDFHFFKTEQTGENGKYSDRSVLINLDSGRLIWLERELKSVSRERQSLERTETDIPVEKILSIAEDASGRNFRAHYLNDCRIGGILNEALDHGSWKVTYTADGVGKSLDLKIDRKTGAVSTWTQ